MLRFRAMATCAVALLLAFYCGGCLPGDSRVDEEKDPHFQRGRTLVEGQDWTGAVAEFEKALESNPRSARAHFELGWLYESKIFDYAAAIYHYERYLQIQPTSERTESIDVKERIRGCKQQLANTEFPLPNAQNLQHEIDRLNAENLLLHQQLDMLRSQSAASAAVTPAPVEQPRPQPQPQPRPQPVSLERRTPIPAPTATSTPPTPTPTPASHRVHVVRQGETIKSIAAQYGLKTSSILAANPGIEPRRLHVGQSLNLP